MFMIPKLEYIGSGKFMVGGRNCENELRKGDTLRVECESIPENIEVTIDEISMYGRTVTEVDSGLTACLLFDDNLARYFALGGKLSGVQE